MRRPLVPALRLLGLLATGLVLAHQSIYLVRYGSIYGEALVHAGHGQAWSDAATSVLVSAAVLAAIAIVRLVRLGALVATLELATGAGSPGPADAGDARRRPSASWTMSRLRFGAAAVGWLRTFAVVGPTLVVALTIQENVEHAAAGLAVPGIGILLSAEYPMAIPIVLAVAAAVSLVTTILAWTRATLIARLRVARRRQSLRAPRAVRPAVARAATLHRGSPLARRLGRRAPPLALSC